MTSILYLGMDVHSTSYTLCTFSIGDENAKNIQTIAPDYKLVLKYMERVRSLHGGQVDFICGYEAGCLGYTLYHQLTSCGVNCVILAPSTMEVSPNARKKKNDRRDAERIARCLAYHTFSAVHIPTFQDDQVKEYIRMRDDHKKAQKSVKQQILSFCLRHGYKYEKQNWTAAHLKWISTLSFKPLEKEILEEYLLTYRYQEDKIQRLDKRIEELAQLDAYRENVKMLSCLLGVRTHTALSVLVEVGDFHRFSSADRFAAYLGLVPGEDSSAEHQKNLPITKAGNSHLRSLLTESAHCFSRGKIGYKSKALINRQAGNPPQIIAYADRANERLRRKYYHMISRGKKSHVSRIAVARELACFIWGMMTGHTA